MMRRLQPGAVTLLTPHSRGNDRSDDDNAEDMDADVADGRADDDGDFDDETDVVSLSFSSFLAVGFRLRELCLLRRYHFSQRDPSM